jgi:hypothetical protein
VAEVLAPEGPLAERKVFSRRDVIVAVAPRLFGQHPRELEALTDAVLADPEAVPLVAVPSASQRPYATATTIAREHAIAAAVAMEVARTDAPAVDEHAARLAIAAREADLGTHLSVGQRAAVLATATSGRGVELIVGVAGAGKTTALAALREAFESDGYRVLGTSTSGQAARTLGRAAGIEPSRTLASLTWRLNQGQLALDHRSVIVLDEAAMTEDRMLLDLLQHAAAARSKVVMVGDHRQLGAVGPGGGFEALVARYGPAVHVLADNVRQRDVAERAALGELHDGDVAKAVASYARRGRIVVAPDRIGAIERLVEGWAADVAEHDAVAMYAYLRADVAGLNRAGRQVWRSLRRLEGPDLVAPGGTAYAVGDRVVSLAPAAGGAVVTSQTATVVAVRAEARALMVRMDDDGEVHRLEGPEIGAEPCPRLRRDRPSQPGVHRGAGSCPGGRRWAGAGLCEDEPGPGPHERLCRGRLTRTGQGGPGQGVRHRPPPGLGDRHRHAHDRPAGGRAQPERGPPDARRPAPGSTPGRAGGRPGRHPARSRRSNPGRRAAAQPAAAGA